MKVKLNTQVRIPNSEIYIPKGEIMQVEDVVGKYYICEYFSTKLQATFYVTIYKENCEVIRNDK